MDPTLFELAPQEFEGVITELGLPQSEADQLRRQYRRQNSMFAGLYGLLDSVAGRDAEQGRVRADVLPMTRPEGMTGIEALLSGNAELAIPGGLLGGAEAAAMGIDAPAAAYQGMIPAENMVGEALGTGGMAMTGGMLPNAGRLMEFDPTTVSIFGGRNARTADLSALRRAERMQARGATGEEIWQDTGWFQGADGQWRFEINDTGSQMRPAAMQFAGDYIPLRDAFSHLEMQRAYPEMFSLTGNPYRFTELPAGTPEADFRGSFDRDTGDIKVSTVSSPSMNEARSVTLHELQHAIQRAEGFTPGASFGTASDILLRERRMAADALERQMERRQRELGLEGYLPQTNDPELRQLQDDYMFATQRAISEQEIYDLYRRAYGEAEARLVQSRMDMTPQQRRENYPPAMMALDVPENQQLLQLEDYLAQYGLLNQ